MTASVVLLAEREELPRREKGVGWQLTSSRETLLNSPGVGLVLHSADHGKFHLWAFMAAGFVDPSETCVRRLLAIIRVCALLYAPSSSIIEIDLFLASRLPCRAAGSHTPSHSLARPPVGKPGQAAFRV